MLPQPPADGEEARTKEASGQQTSLARGRGGGCLQPALLLGSPSELPSLPCAPARVPTPSHLLPWCSSIIRAPFSLVFSLELCLRLALHSVLGCGPQLCLPGYAFPSFTSSTFSLFTLFISFFLCFASSLPACLSISPLGVVCYLGFSPSLSLASALSLCLPVSSIPPSLCLSPSRL